MFSVATSESPPHLVSASIPVGGGSPRVAEQERVCHRHRKVAAHLISLTITYDR